MFMRDKMWLEYNYISISRKVIGGCRIGDAECKETRYTVLYSDDWYAWDLTMDSVTME